MPLLPQQAQQLTRQQIRRDEAVPRLGIVGLHLVHYFLVEAMPRLYKKHETHARKSKKTKIFFLQKNFFCPTFCTIFFLLSNFHKTGKRLARADGGSNEARHGRNFRSN